MQETFWATMLRCADIIANITHDDVLQAQAVLLANGIPLERVAQIDRAMLAEKHIRACVIVSKKNAAKEAAGR
jgi:hypothetical protein